MALFRTTKRAVFTGLVEQKGSLRSRSETASGARLRVGSTYPALTLGESISVDGVCLTVTDTSGGDFHCDASTETLSKTTLGRLPVGAPVNLERALAVGSRLGGHIVTGHVDGVGTLQRVNDVGSAREMHFAIPDELAVYVAAKGSITVNGVSLTVNSVSGHHFSVMIIPHTLEVTSLSSLRVGVAVNIEVDILARYVARLLQAGRAHSPAPSADEDANEKAWLDRLHRAGFV